MYDFINAVKTLCIEMNKYNKILDKQKYLRDELSIPDEFKKLRVNKNNISLNSTRVAYGLRLGLSVSITFFLVNLFNIEFCEWGIYNI